MTERNKARTTSTVETAATTAPEGISTNEPISAVQERKRSPKIEVKYRGRIYLVSGEKGGVGKTLSGRCIVEMKRRAGSKVLPVEADAANLDFQKLFNLNGHINLQKEGGYIDLLNYVQSAGEQEDVVISLPAGALAGAEVRGQGFLDGLPYLEKDLNKEVIVVWPIDDKETSVVMLRDFHARCPEMRIDVIGNRFFFDRFAVYEQSRTKQMIEEANGNFMQLPRLNPKVMQILVNDNLSFCNALNIMPIGTKYELQHWLRSIEREFARVGYIDELGR